MGSFIMKETRGKRFNSNLGYGYRLTTRSTGKIKPLPKKINLSKSKRIDRMIQINENGNNPLPYILTIGGSYYLFKMVFKILNTLSNMFESEKIKLIKRLKYPGFAPFYVEMFAVLIVFYFILYMKSRHKL